MLPQPQPSPRAPNAIPQSASTTPTLTAAVKPPQPVSTIQSSPPISHPSIPSQAQASTNNQAQAPAQPGRAAPVVKFLPDSLLSQFQSRIPLDMLEKLKATESMIKERAQAAAKAEMEGRHAEAEMLKAANTKPIEQMKAFQIKLRQLVQQTAEQQARAGEQSRPIETKPSIAADPVTTSQQTISKKQAAWAASQQPAQTGHPTPHSALPPNVGLSQPQPHQQPAQPHVHPDQAAVSAPVPGPSTMTHSSHTSPLLAAQMQKLIDQHNKATAHVPSINTPAVTMSEQPTPAPSSTTAGQGAPPHWKGLLTWSGSDSGTHARRDMQASVVIFTKNVDSMCVIFSFSFDVSLH
jgi:hypothetical protein